MYFSVSPVACHTRMSICCQFELTADGGDKLSSSFFRTIIANRPSVSDTVFHHLIILLLFLDYVSVRLSCPTLRTKKLESFINSTVNNYQSSVCK